MPATITLFRFQRRPFFTFAISPSCLIGFCFVLSFALIKQSESPPSNHISTHNQSNLHHKNSSNGVGNGGGGIKRSASAPSLDQKTPQNNNSRQVRSGTSTPNSSSKNSTQKPIHNTTTASKQKSNIPRPKNQVQRTNSMKLTGSPRSPGDKKPNVFIINPKKVVVSSIQLKLPATRSRGGGESSSSHPTKSALSRQKNTKNKQQDKSCINRNPKRKSNSNQMWDD